MVQILPYIESPLQQLMPHISEAAGQIGKGLKQRSALGALQAYYNKPAQNTKTASPGQESTQNSPQAQGGINPLDVGALYLNALNASGGDENYARQLVGAETKKQALEQKNLNEMAKEERVAERKLQETEQVPFFERIAKDRDVLPSAIQSSDQVIDAIIKGDIGPGSLPHIGRVAQDLGIPKSITHLLESPDSKEFNSGIKQLMGRTIKDTFRGTTSQREIDIAEAVQAEIGVNPQANLAAAWAVQSDLMFRQEQLKLYDQLIDQGVPRTKIPAIISKKIEPFRKQLKDEYFQAIEQMRGKK